MLADLPFPPPRLLILVDPLVEWPQKPSPGAERHFGNGKPSCHLTVDGPIEALHVFARRIGLRREWFQASPPASWPHYDLTPSKRALALEIGALAMPANHICAREDTWRAAAHDRDPRIDTSDDHECFPCAMVKDVGGFALADAAWQERVRKAKLAMALGTRHRAHGELLTLKIKASDLAHLDRDGFELMEQYATMLPEYEPREDPRRQERELAWKLRDVVMGWADRLTRHRGALAWGRGHEVIDLLRAALG